MSGHADTIPYLRAMLEADERRSFLAALDALLAENQRLREALKAARTFVEFAGYTLVEDSSLVKQIDEALAGDGE